MADWLGCGKPVPRRMRSGSRGRVSGLLAPVCAAVLALVWPLGCGADLGPEERVLFERQKFEVELISWAPVDEGRLALDLQIEVQGQSDLEWLTVEVRQVGVNEELLRADPVSLDVAGMEFDGRRMATTHVPSAGDAVSAVAVVREDVPEVAKRGAYREFSGL